MTSSGNVVCHLNILSVKLGHEECDECEQFTLHDNTHNKDNLTEDCGSCVKRANHRELANKSTEQSYQTLN